MIFSKFTIDYGLSNFKINFIYFIDIGMYFGTFSTSNKHRFYFNRSYFIINDEKVAAYWNKILIDNETYSAARAGSLPYMANNIKVTDFHGLVYPNMGRDRTLKGSRMGKWGTKKFDYVFYPKNHILFDANHYNFAKVYTEKPQKEIYN